MASIHSANTAISSAVDLPELWDAYVVQLLEANLVADKVTRDFSYKIKSGGDIIHIPENKILQTAATMTEGNRLSDKLQADTEGEITITLNQYKVNPFFITKKLDAQSIYDEKAMKFKKAAYAVRDVFDDYVLALSSGFATTDVNSGGSTLTNLDITEAWTRLNANNVPSEDRNWVFNPWAIKDLYDLTGNYFTSIDFATNKPIVNGQMPKKYDSTKLFTIAAEKNIKNSFMLWPSCH